MKWLLAFTFIAAYSLFVTLAGCQNINGNRDYHRLACSEGFVSAWEEPVNSIHNYLGTWDFWDESSTWTFQDKENRIAVYRPINGEKCWTEWTGRDEL